MFEKFRKAINSWRASQKLEKYIYSRDEPNGDIEVLDYAKSIRKTMSGDNIPGTVYYYEPKITMQDIIDVVDKHYPKKPPNTECICGKTFPTHQACSAHKGRCVVYQDDKRAKGDLKKAKDLEV